MVELDDLFGKREFARLLLFFIKNPSGGFSQSEIQNKLKIAKATMVKWISELERFSLINIKKQAVSKICSLNRSNIIIKQLKIVNNLLQLGKLKGISERHNLQIYLYGSCARGEDVEESDIDLLVIGKAKKEDLIREINKVSDSINRKIAFEIFSPMQWSEMSQKDKAFYERVEKDKVLL
jgi:predicted nucleotidyltransferase